MALVHRQQAVDAGDAAGDDHQDVREEEVAGDDGEHDEEHLRGLLGHDVAEAKGEAGRGDPVEGQDVELEDALDVVRV